MSCSKKVLLKPIILTKKNNRQVVLAHKRMTPNLILSNLKVATMPRFKEDVIYESSNCDFLKGESQHVRIVNKANIATKTCRTIAKCTAKGVSVETTSDDVCAVIGQKQYDTVLSALCSVFNEETKVRGILALLTKQTTYRTTATQTETDVVVKKECTDSSCQTVESHPEILGKQKQRKRLRKAHTPYVVKEAKKCIINIDNFIKKEEFKTEDLKKEIQEEQKVNTPELPVLNNLNEDSNMSCESTLTSLSRYSSHSDLVHQSKVEDLLNTINKQTYSLNLHLPVYDGSKIMIPVKPEDEFHIAIPDILNNVTSAERLKLLYHQAMIDYKRCLDLNEDGYYPLHIAVLQSDVDLIRRQCIALRWKQQSVDKQACGMTALQMAIHHNSTVACTRVLMEQGADPLLGDAERRSALHLAAGSADSSRLKEMLEYCDRHPKEVLKNNQDFWDDKMENMATKDLAIYLYEKIGELFDDQGNTPLMVAATSGRFAAAELLATRCRSSVNVTSPACGSTALYRSVAAACVHAKDHGGSDNVPDHFLKTAEALVRRGANPAIENHSGSSVNSLLQENNIAKLSMIIANGMTVDLPSNMILVKDKDGKIAPEQTKKKKEKLDAETVTKLIEINRKRKQDMADQIAALKAAKCSKSVNVAKDPRGTKLLAFPTQNPYRKGVQETRYYRINNACLGKDGSNIAVSKTTNLPLQNDRIADLKLVSSKNSLNKAKSSDAKSRVVIVDNVSVKTDFPKVNMPPATIVSTVVSSKPKDIVLVSTKKDTNSPKYVNIAPNAKNISVPPGTSKTVNRKS